MSTKIRINVNTRSLARLITLLGNATMLAANSYLIGRSFTDHIRDRKRERIMSSLEIASQALGTLASVSNVVINTIESNAKKP